MATSILGITAYRSDSAAALLRDGEIVAAVREESFSRRRGDAAFPAAAIGYCLRETQLTLAEIDQIVFCDALQGGGGLGNIVSTLRRAQLQVMLRRELAALGGEGLLALPSLTLISRPQAAAELRTFAELCPGVGDGDSLWRNDAACAIGATLHLWHEQLGNPRRAVESFAPHGAPWFGPWFGSDGLCDWLDELGVAYRRLDDAALIDEVGRLLVAGRVVGWLQGRQEFGARSFGARSILGDPRAPALRTLLGRNRRTNAPPLAATLDLRQARDWLQLPARAAVRQLFGAAPGDPCCHLIDGTAQPRLYRLLDLFARSSGCPLLANASFCGGDEPLVATPVDAYRCFMRSDIDCLVMEDVILLKAQQPLWEERGD